MKYKSKKEWSRSRDLEMRSIEISTNQSRSVRALLMTEHNDEEEARRKLNNIGKTISEYYSRDINRNFYC